jgi:hypothetical protein
MLNLIPHRTCVHTAELPVSTDGQMDRQTDELIWGGLGNLRFLQVNGYNRSDLTVSSGTPFHIVFDLILGKTSFLLHFRIARSCLNGSAISNFP